jgi:hypothetical protein
MTKRNISAIGEAAFQTRNYHSGVLLLEHLLQLWQKTQVEQTVKPPGMTWLESIISLCYAYYDDMSYDMTRLLLYYSHQASP